MLAGPVRIPSAGARAARVRAALRSLLQPPEFAAPASAERSRLPGRCRSSLSPEQSSRASCLPSGPRTRPGHPRPAPATGSFAARMVSSGSLAQRSDIWYRDGMADVMVGLADAIGALRQALMIAMEDGKDADMRFRLAPVELSLQVAVTKEAGGKIAWHVLGLGGSYSSAMTQTLKMRLEPLWKQDDGSYTSDFTIADAASESPPRIGPQSMEASS
jgi:hypothetical protein